MTRERTPRVTIIVTTYNRSSKVERAIRSLLDQDYSHVEIVVVDDGSTDNTTDVLHAFQIDRLAVIRLNVNGGVTNARNVGLGTVGQDVDYVGFLDSDDCLIPGAISTLVRAVNDGEPHSIIMGWAMSMVGGSTRGSARVGSSEVTYDDALSGRFSGDFFLLARADLMRGRRFDPRAQGGEGSVWLALMREAPALLVHEVVLLVDTGGQDRISLETFDVETCRRKMWVSLAILEAAGEDLPARYPHRYADLHLEAAKWAAMAGDRRRYWASMFAASKVAPSIRLIRVGLFALMPSWVARALQQNRRRRDPTRPAKQARSEA